MLSIIIPAFNSEKTLPTLLDSIHNSDFKDYEITIVDDFSSDSTASIIKNYTANGVFLSAHSGPAIARNKGAEIARGEILVFFDSDIKVESNTLAKIARRFKENQDIKVLVGIYSDKPLNEGYFPRFKAIWFKSLFKENDIQTDSLEGFCVAIDKEVFKSIGGFNPSLERSGIEDYELGCRLRQKYPLYFDASIQVRHNFPNFFKNGMKFFRRSSDFAVFYLSQDKVCRGSPLNRDGLVSLFSFASFLLFPFLSIRSSSIIFIFLFFIISFIFFGWKFINLVFRKEGLFFSVISIFTYYINGVIIGLGIVIGFLRYLLRAK